MESTIKREMKEELDVKIKVGKHLSPIDHIIPEENQHWVTSTFIAKIVKGTPKIMELEKCSEIGWFSMEELDKLPLSIASGGSLVQLKELFL